MWKVRGMKAGRKQGTTHHFLNSCTQTFPTCTFVRCQLDMKKLNATTFSPNYHLYCFHSAVEHW